MNAHVIGIIAGVLVIAATAGRCVTALMPPRTTDSLLFAGLLAGGVLQVMAFAIRHEAGPAWAGFALVTIGLGALAWNDAREAR